ncbi:response regulator [Legionella sp. km772]|uniref:response regulator n=1 Tax=Legionella sp. km772 TaxID=2498111 RepID=UPI000F8E7491|nr:response regulator [Legionella sp. km772]RUR05510.1 response regulator [Legionella sp. km772]
MHEPYILLVDDNQSIRDCLIWVLEDEGYGVITASNGQEALDLLEKAPSLPDFILLDLMMPIMNGWQFRERQRLNPRFKTIPTLILSAKINIENQVFYPNEYLLPKPFDIEELLELIREKID